MAPIGSSESQSYPSFQKIFWYPKISLKTKSDDYQPPKDLRRPSVGQGGHRLPFQPTECLQVSGSTPRGVSLGAMPPRHATADYSKCVLMINNPTISFTVRLIKQRLKVPLFCLLVTLFTLKSESNEHVASLPV